MVALVQRVSSASVYIGMVLQSQIQEGLLVFVGVYATDNELHAQRLAHKVAHLRAFEDAVGKANLSVRQTRKEVLLISQFTLCANTAQGHRPSFAAAAPARMAEPLYRVFVSTMQELLSAKQVQEGRFGANMQVTLLNRGPYTIILKS